MKKLLAITALLAASSTSVLAQTAATQDVNLSANVPAFCTIGGVNAATPALTGNVNPQITNGQVTGGLLSLSGSPSAVVCNSNVRIDLASEKAGLTGPGTVSPGFTNKIHYSVVATVSDATSATFNTSSVSPTVFVDGTFGTAGAFTAGSLSIAVTTASTAPDYLLPGAYSDKLTVRLTPQ